MEPKNLKNKFLLCLSSLLLSSCIVAQNIDDSVISEAKRTKILKINNQNRFEYIPKVVFTLKDLKILSFTGTQCDIKNQECNNITEIPHDIEKLIYLEELYLVMNHIDSLPIEINSLRKLRVLDLSNNKGINITNINIENLEILNLNGCDLKEIPHNIFKLKKLKTLGLEENYDISEEEIERIKKVLPDCEIFWK